MAQSLYYSTKGIMKRIFFTNRITKWSFAFAASVIFYLGIPEEQKSHISDLIHTQIIDFFNLSKLIDPKVDQNRFAPDLSSVDKETAYYFNKIVRYSESKPLEMGPVYKWNKNVKIYLHGKPSRANRKEVVKVIIELNRLIYPIKIQLVQRPEEANSFVYFGSIAGYNDSPFSEIQLPNSYFGHFHIKSYEYEIQKALVFINTQETSPKRQKHIIREEIVQSLGFINDTYDFKESIFYQGYSEKSTFSSLDESIIKLLYQGR